MPTGKAEHGLSVLRGCERGREQDKIEENKKKEKDLWGRGGLLDNGVARYKGFTETLSFSQSHLPRSNARMAREDGPDGFMT